RNLAGGIEWNHKFHFEGLNCSNCLALLHGNHLIAVMDRRRRKEESATWDGPPHDAIVGLGLLLHKTLLCLCLCL
ncbi:hypothetical protein ACLOJK_019234, partial [Asimina triloba]